jgi:hypothetical protein
MRIAALVLATLLGSIVAHSGPVPQRILTLDVTKTDTPWSLTATRGESIYIRVDTYYRGAPYTNRLGGWLWYANSAADSTGVRISSSASETGSVWFLMDSTNSLGLTTNPAAYFAQIILTNATVLSEWSRGTFTNRNGGGITGTGVAPTATTFNVGAYSYVGVFPQAVIPAVFVETNDSRYLSAVTNGGATVNGFAVSNGAAIVITAAVGSVSWPAVTDKPSVWPGTATDDVARAAIIVETNRAQQAEALLLPKTATNGAEWGSHANLATNAGAEGAGYYAMSNGSWMAFSPGSGSVQTEQLYVAQAGTAQVAVVATTVTGTQSNIIASSLTNAAAFATAAQGTKADTALQPVDTNGWTVTTHSGLLISGVGGATINGELITNGAAFTIAGGGGSGGGISNIAVAGVSGTLSGSGSNVVASVSLDALAGAGVATNGQPVTLAQLPAAVLTNAAAFATAAQGTNADTALQPSATNGWVVSSHSSFLTTESDPVFATNGVKISDTNGWVVSSHAAFLTAETDPIWGVVSNAVRTGAAAGATALQPTGSGSSLTNITAAQVGAVPTNRTLTINGQVGTMDSNLTFTVAGGGDSGGGLSNIVVAGVSGTLSGSGSNVVASVSLDALAGAGVQTNVPTLQQVVTAGGSVTSGVVAIDAANARTNTYGGSLGIGPNRWQASEGAASGEASWANYGGTASGVGSWANNDGVAGGQASWANFGGTASGVGSWAMGTTAVASNSSSFSWRNQYSHGTGSFNIGAPNLLWLQNTNLQTLLDEKVSTNGSGSGLTGITAAQVGAVSNTAAGIAAAGGVTGGVLSVGTSVSNVNGLLYFPTNLLQGATGPQGPAGTNGADGASGITNAVVTRIVTYDTTNPVITLAEGTNAWYWTPPTNVALSCTFAGPGAGWAGSGMLRLVRTNNDNSVTWPTNVAWIVNGTRTTNPPTLHVRNAIVVDYFDGMWGLGLLTTNATVVP